MSLSEGCFCGGIPRFQMVVNGPGVDPSSKGGGPRRRSQQDPPKHRESFKLFATFGFYSNGGFKQASGLSSASLRERRVPQNMVETMMHHESM